MVLKRLHRRKLLEKANNKNLDNKRSLPASLTDVESGIKKDLNHSSDLKIKYLKQYESKLALFYIDNLTDTETLNRDVLPTIQSLNQGFSVSDIIQQLPVGGVKKASELNQVINQIIRGWSYLHIDGNSEGLLIQTSANASRSLSSPEIEGQILGPQVSFTESLSTNTSLVRQLITNPKLCNEMLKVGKQTGTKVSIFYIEEIASEQNVNTLRQRISELEFDGIIDSSILLQLIDDNSMTIFPLSILTERPDRVATSLLEGKLAVLVEGSPFAIITPSTFMDFFKSTEDHYVRWGMGAFIRAIRVFGMILSVLFTPAYVAALTFHYEIIPSAMLVQLAQSRSRVPFPPLFEALLLELIIEFLREAGARLPTKVGQTMGIVGGIVIGTAAVQAGFTSNILIIIVALGALTSFTAPSYIMGTAIRFARFPMIIIAGIWGAIGLMVGVSFLLIHLLRQTSLGSPYLHPFYPLRFRDLKESMLRVPFQYLAKRSTYPRGQDQWRYNERKAMRKKDIDE